MDASIGAQIFWMIALGLTIGLIGYYIHYMFREPGIGLLLSILVALAGSLFTGVIALILRFNMAITAALIGSLAFLFIVNVFRQKDRTVFIDTDRSGDDQD